MTIILMACAFAVGFFFMPERADEREDAVTGIPFLEYSSPLFSITVCQPREMRPISYRVSNMTATFRMLAAII